MSKPTRGLADQVSKLAQLQAARAKAAELAQHLDDSAQLEDIQHQADAAEPKLAGLCLTATQQAYLDQILLDVADHRISTVGLFGYAGVGKTVTTGAIVNALLKQYGSGVAICATTHKAARQVERAMAGLGVNGVEVITIHRLLGVRLVRDYQTGEEYFAADRRNPPKLDDSTRVVILDETSMLECRLYQTLMGAIGHGQTVLFVGDDRQIPPPSDGKLCPAFGEGQN